MTSKLERIISVVVAGAALVLGVYTHFSVAPIVDEEEFEARLREKISIDARDDAYFYWGADTYWYSDDHDTQKLHIDGATGDIDTEGAVNFAGAITSSGGLDLNGTGVITFDADADTVASATLDDIITVTLGITTGHLDIATGNLRVGGGTPGTTQDGEDLYVTGASEFDGAAAFDGTLDVDGATTLNSTLDVDGNISSGTGALTFTTNMLANSFVIYGEQTVVEATSAGTITPTGTYQPITSTAVVTLGTTAIADGSTEGQYLCLVNENASDTIAISDGQNTNLSGNTVLGNDDTLCVIWDGADWVEVSQVDN